MADDYTGEWFARVGLKVNNKKTKGAVIDGAKPPTMMSQVAFNQIKGVGKCRTHWEKALPTIWSHVTEKGACEAPVGRSVQEGQRHIMGDKPRKSGQQSSHTKPSHRVDSGGGAVCLPQEYCVDILAGGAKEIQCPAQAVQETTSGSEQ